jgi:hypothetical protein
VDGLNVEKLGFSPQKCFHMVKVVKKQNNGNEIDVNLYIKN